MKKSTGNSNLSLLSTFLFSTNPIITTNTSITAYQGIAYVFLSMILALVSCKRRKAKLLSIFIWCTLVLTHHWTNYMLIAYFTAVTFFQYLSNKKSINFNLKIPLSLILFGFITFISWQVYVAPNTLIWHGEIFKSLIQGLLQFHTAIEGELLHYFGPKPFYEIFFLYLGVIIFVMFGLLGSIISLKKERKFEAYLFLFSMGITFFIFYVIPWHLILDLELRRRILDFEYIYAVPAVLIGILTLRNFLSRKSRKLGTVLIILLILLLTPPQIILRFPRRNYTANPPGDVSFGFASEEWMTTALWVNEFIPPKARIAGGSLAYTYIGGNAIWEIETNLLYLLHDILSGYTIESFLIIDKFMIKDLGISYNFTAEDLNKIQSRARLNFNMIYNIGKIDISRARMNSL